MLYNVKPCFQRKHHGSFEPHRRLRDIFNLRMRRRRNWVKLLKSSPASVQPDMVAIGQATDRKLAVAMVTLGLRAVGSFGFPLLTLLSWPGNIYLASIFIRLVWQEWQTERKVGVNAISAANLSFMPLVGYAIPVTLYYVLVFFSRKLLLKTRNKSRQEL